MRRKLRNRKRGPRWDRPRCRLVLLKGDWIDNQVYGIQQNQLSILDATPIRRRLSPVAAAAIPLLTLHQRFGHLSLPNLQRAISSGQLQGQTWTYSAAECNTFACNTCKTAKATRTPFQTLTSRASQPLKLVHSDVLTLPEPTSDGERYVVTFIDDYSRKMWVKALKNKSQVFETLKSWHTMIERSTGLPLRTLQTDNGAERLNHTIVEGTIALLQQSGLPMKLWQEALLYVVDTKNLSPHSALDHKIPDAHKRSKLEPKAKPFIFVGFNNKSKAWTLYDPTMTLFFLSRDIQFDEQVFPARDAPIGPPQPCMPPTTGEWTFVNAAHALRAPPRLSTPPVVHQNRFAVLETEDSDDATIDMSNNSFDTPSDMGTSVVARAR
ncbi:BQ5605_C006g03812 [Microbotryum silenes-dioicae]|uniref:BQ5605_C006g03812 protein n=1 Tax=Microbotryum silenes-dioicae TaxID=796604 RepID=A0A2X0P7P3_9BASI|nr:BQ5605_C006g03812 [Microbotryum silenes-dioicae]